LTLGLHAQEEHNRTLQAHQALIDMRPELQELIAVVDPENIWVKRFLDHRDYLTLRAEKERLEGQMKRLAPRRDLASQEAYADLQKRVTTLQTRLDLLGEIGLTPYENLTHVDPLPEPPQVRNPFAILTALSYIKEAQQLFSDHRERLDGLKETIAVLKRKRELLAKQRTHLEVINDPARLEQNQKLLRQSELMISAFEGAREVYATALGVQERRFAAQEATLKRQITNETLKLVYILVAIALLIGALFLSKILMRRTIKDTQRLYSASRAANIITVLVILLVLVFNYINNILYFVTLLGFISAGIAIAMKDWFMSMLGWVVIVIGGSIHVGDRLRVVHEGDVVVGDVLEIGLTRIMLFEDITLETFEVNRRAGRIIHIPNNYIFTRIIQNYSYDEMKTVWDGIDVVISFTSNHKKALKIAKEVAARHAKGYTDITRKHYNNLRMRYNMRTVSVEPRVYTFAHTYGVKVSLWYLTNSYATLTLRSTISAEVIDAFNAAEDIQIAYPTYAYQAGGMPQPKMPADQLDPGWGAKD
jgi:small-conductance mechanosensitive channel